MVDEPKKTNYKPVFALLSVVLLTAVLLTPTNAFGSQGTEFIDAELKGASSEDRVYVNTRYPIGDAERLEQFPKDLGPWRMTHEYDWDNIADFLDTDVLLARDYRAQGVYIPVSLVIIQSHNMSSFHPAPVCYRAQGFTILENETSSVEVPMAAGAWAAPGIFEGDNREFKGAMTAKRLVVEREMAQGATQRQLVLYMYMKAEKGNVVEKAAWVRLSMFIPARGDYASHEAILVEMMGRVVPELFDPAPQQAPAPLYQTIIGSFKGA